MLPAAVHPARVRASALLVPLALVLAAGCGGTDPIAPNFGRGGTPGPLGAITLNLIEQPANAQDITFNLTTVSAGTKLSAGKGKVTLDDDTDPTLPNTRTWPSLAAGTYHLAIGTLPNGSVVSSLDCIFIGGNGTIDRPAGTVDIVLDAAGQVTCTFIVSAT